MTDHVYRVRNVARIIDADTCILEVDLGFWTSSLQRFRLARIDAPERGQAGYLDSSSYARAWFVTAAQPLTVASTKADSFGRWIGDVRDANDRSLSDALLAAGHAVPYVRSAL